MAPAEEPDRTREDADKDPHQDRSSPFVNFRRSVDNLAASIFTDLAETFPSLQKFVPPPEKSFFDEWAREVFRRFNDSYERSTNPERKRIERMSCYDDGDQINDKDKMQGLGRRWVDRRTSASSQQDGQGSVDPHARRLGALDWPRAGSSGGGLFESLSDKSRTQRPWRPSMDYFIYSPYSPLRLEANSVKLKGSTTWRGAFEDLLRVEQGLPMNTVEEHARKQTEDPGVWCSRLDRAGFVRDSGTFPFLFDVFGLQSAHPLIERAGIMQLDGPGHHRDFLHAQQDFKDLPDDATDEQVAAAREAAAGITKDLPETELEQYEQWLRHRDNRDPEILLFPFLWPSKDEYEGDDGRHAVHAQRENRFEEEHSSSRSLKPNTENSGPEVLESFSETERRVLPDGSILVHTKVKKKFADGTEWNDESTTLTGAGDAHKGDSRREERPTKNVDDASQKHKSILDAAKDHQKKTEKKKGGWFWSN